MSIISPRQTLPLRLRADHVLDLLGQGEIRSQAQGIRTFNGPLRLGPFDDDTDLFITASDVGGGITFTRSSTFDTAGQSSPVPTASLPYSPVYPSLDKWIAARARGAADPARHITIGDSNFAGLGQGTSGTLNIVGAEPVCIPTRIGNLLGYNQNNFFGDQNFAPNNVALSDYDPRVTMPSGWTTLGTANTVGARFIIAPGGTAGQFSFTPTEPFSSFDLFFPTTGGASSSCSVYVDGALVDAFSQKGSDGTTKRHYTVPSGTHTIGLGVGSGSTDAMFVGGVITYSGDNRPILIRDGWSGGKASDFCDASAPYKHLPVVQFIAPDFATVYCTVNDINNATPADTYYGQIEALVSGICGTANGCLCVGFPSNASGAINGTLNVYAAALRSIAQDYGWGYFDFRSVFGSSFTAASARGFAYDNYHPNAVGSAAAAAGYAAFLTAAGMR